MKALFFVFILIIFQKYFVIAQENYNRNFTTRFEKMYLKLCPQSNINYYPFTEGDYWEFIETDTTTIAGQFYESGLNFSVTKEILFDSVLSNGLTYKKIKWNNEANSIIYPSVYEYHRKDSLGNVYLFYQDNDYLLFDVNANTGDIYPAHLPGFIWSVADKYNVIGFGDTLAAIDFNLLENGTTLKETYTLVENFGLIYYRKNISGYNLPEGNFWGAVINGDEFGTLIINKQQVDWPKFYPLHIGDYWVYEGNEGSIQTELSNRVVGDSTISGGSRYYKILRINHTFGYTEYTYERLDSLGRLHILKDENTESVKLKLSDTVGDTLKWYINPSFEKRLDNKYSNQYYDNRDALLFFLYPDISYTSEEYTFGLGITELTGDQVQQNLKGAYIDGIIWGDTLLTNIEEENNLETQQFLLYQNYPNPFNSMTKISFYLPVSSNIQLIIFNMLGEQVKIICNGYYNYGFHSVILNANYMSSGIYICVLNTNKKRVSEKIVLLK